MMKKQAIIVAGGTGQRMKGEVPKQFLKLNGKPILIHTMEKFILADPSISLVLVIPKSFQSLWYKLCTQHEFSHHHIIVSSGETRFKSVKNGLAVCKNEGFICIHDGVRPLVSSELILRLYNAAISEKSAVPVCSLVNSIRKLNGSNSKSVKRDSYVLVQTPQCFSSALIYRAYSQDEQDQFTDDASVVEALGEKIYLLSGEPHNIKITTPLDLILSEAILTKQ